MVQEDEQRFTIFYNNNDDNNKEQNKTWRWELGNETLDLAINYLPWCCI